MSERARQDEFEIIDQHNARHTFSRSGGFSWRRGLKDGTTDGTDRSYVEVTHENDDGVVVVVAAFRVGPLTFKKSTFEAKAKRMSLSVEWSVHKGCMIEHKPGEWIPIANYRAFENN